MPSSILPLLVDLKELKNVFGSKNAKLLKEIIRKRKIDDEDTDPDDYEVVEGEEDDDFDEDDVEEIPSSKDALTHIIMGQPWARGIGSKYGYMFMEICQHLGQRLDGNYWGATRAQYVSEFDKVLAKLKVPVATISMQGLVWGGGTFNLPPRSDAPFYGTLTTSQAAKAAKALAAVDRKALQAASQKVKISRGAVESEFVIACFEELQAWCQTSVSQKRDLIVFYY